MSLVEPRTDKEYEARWDAETLVNAERIKADPARLSTAQSAAKAMAAQQDEKQKALRKVAGKSTTDPEQTKGIKKAVTTNKGNQSGGLGIASNPGVTELSHLV